MSNHNGQQAMQLKQPTPPKIPPVLTAAQLPGHGLTEDREYRAIEYQNVDLSGQDIETAEVSQCRFSDSALASTTIHQLIVSDTIFSRCDVSNVNAKDSSLLRTTMTTSRLTGMTWIRCLFRDVLFDSCRADLATFRFSKFKSVVFRDCQLRQVDFQNADLRETRFEGCDLTGAQFSSAEMAGTRFLNCTLVGIGGATSFKGAIIKSDDILGLAHGLANALGIIIEG